MKSKKFMMIITVFVFIALVGYKTWPIFDWTWETKLHEDLDDFYAADEKSYFASLWKPLAEEIDKNIESSYVLLPYEFKEYFPEYLEIEMDQIIELATMAAHEAINLYYLSHYDKINQAFIDQKPFSNFNLGLPRSKPDSVTRRKGIWRIVWSSHPPAGPNYDVIVKIDQHSIASIEECHYSFANW